MLQYKIAKRIYEEIKEKADKTSEENFTERYWYFIFCTLSYANTLTVWSQMDAEEKSSYFEKREKEYLAYAVELHKVCLDLNVDVLDDVLADEEEQSDFACYVQLFVSLSHRGNDLHQPNETDGLA